MAKTTKGLKIKVDALLFLIETWCQVFWVDAYVTMHILSDDSCC
jgi:hypothetical protein